MARYGLFVGINDYMDSDSIRPLRYAVQDAQSLGWFFKGCGFDVEIMTDSLAMSGAIEEWLWDLHDRLRSGDMFLFHFSGHGCQRGKGRLGARQYLRGIIFLRALVLFAPKASVPAK